MSKIYDALQLAEQERSARTATAVDLRDFSPASRGEVLETAEPSEPLSSDPYWDTVSNLVSSAASGPAGVRYVAWAPAQALLPALQESGPNVEQFRSLRSRLFELREMNKGLKSVLISSGMPKDGKSFIAVNLAISLARHKSSRVLLIDGDMRRSSLDRILGCPGEPGLTAYLAGTASLNEILQRPVADGHDSRAFPGLASLTFIPGGNEGDKAADLAGSPRFKQLLEEASPHFDWIVVDSSPVNLVADAVNLAHVCDGVILIARAGVSTYAATQRALSELKTSNVLGVVLNAAENVPVSGYYYGYSADKS
jgi:capsular exopolysaccharide synthesis family protein